MTREEAIADIKNNIKPVVGGKSLDMAIEALSADTVSREEYEELYRKAKEVNEMANDILADFPNYKELLSVAELKPKFESAVPNCQKCAIKELWEETEKEDLVSVVHCKDCRWFKQDSSPVGYGYCDGRMVGREVDYNDYCSYGERRK